VEVSKDRRGKKKKAGESTTTKGVKEDKGILQSEGTASKRNSNEYGRMDDIKGGSNLCRV